MKRIRIAAADRLIAWGYRLDPWRPSIRKDGNGYIISTGAGAVPLARITADMVSMDRPTRP